MRGYITEYDFDLCDQAFPGIVSYYQQLDVKPTTFLELLWGFTNQASAPATRFEVASGPASANAGRSCSAQDDR